MFCCNRLVSEMRSCAGKPDPMFGSSKLASEMRRGAGWLSSRCVVEELPLFAAALPLAVSSLCSSSSSETSSPIESSGSSMPGPGFLASPIRTPCPK